MSHVSKEDTPHKEGDSVVLEEPTPDMTIASSHDSLKQLIEKNNKWAQVLYHQNRAIKRRLTIMAVLSYIKFALLLTPLILGLIYLPPIIADLIEKYNSFLNSSNGGVSLNMIIERIVNTR